MASCRQPEMSRLVAAYELGVLPDEEREALERHLMECDACFEELADMEPVARRVREQGLAPEGKMEMTAEAQGGGLRRFRRRWTVVIGGVAAAALFTVVLARPAVQTVLEGARGPALVPVLGATGRLQLVFGVVMAAGLWVGA